MRTTIRDVAKLAGVSIATISHTINHSGAVSGKTRDRVIRAIRQLNYFPDAAARSFRLGKTGAVGLIVPDISNNFFAAVIEAAECFLAQNGYRLIVASTGENPEQEAEDIRVLSSGIADGLLLISAMPDAGHLTGLARRDFPIVLVDRACASGAFSAVHISSFQAIYRGICHLAARGDRRIGMLCFRTDRTAAREQVSAYRQALRDRDLADRPELLLFSGCSPDNRRSCLDSLLEQRCDGLLLTGELMDPEVLIYLNHRGFRPGENLDVIGFADENSPLYELCADQVDSIVQPVGEMGALAGGQLLYQLEHPESLPAERILTAFYRPRGSEAALCRRAAPEIRGRTEERGELG